MFAFEDQIYEFTPMAIARLDQAKAMLRDGIEELEVANSIGLPGKDPDHNLQLFRILMYYYDNEEMSE